MRLEKSEKLLIQKLFEESVTKKSISDKEMKDLVKLTGDASTRRYYRLTGDVNSYVVCIDDPAVLKSPTSNFLIMQKIFHDEGIRVPLILDSNPQAGYILEEDLGNQTLLLEMGQVDSEDKELEIYTSLIDSLISIHSINVDKYKKSAFTKLFFNTEKLMQEVDFTLKFFCGNYLSRDKDDKRICKIREEMQKICLQLSEQQMVLTHRDLHSRNIMVKDREYIFIDFQDARMGIPQYDLVSLLEDNYYQLMSQNRKKLLKKYWDEFLSATKIQNSSEEFYELYDLMKIQRTFKAIGSFSYIYSTRNDIRYLKYIGFGFEKLRTVLLKHKKFEVLRKNLSSLYYES